MTKEEYHRLLQSDYWKGYSYSIIKERNFTCEDCGAQFPGERNKLQVHHLVYRDIMPWSYKPEELLVLCESCHKKRHGIEYPKDEINDITNKNKNWKDKLRQAVGTLWYYLKKIKWKKAFKLLIYCLFFFTIYLIGKTISDNESLKTRSSEIKKERVKPSKSSKKHKHKKKKTEVKQQEDEKDDFVVVEEEDDNSINNVIDESIQQ